MSEHFGRFALEAARRGLGAYIAGHSPGLKPARHLDRVVIPELEAVERGECLRLILDLPPGHAKSTTGSVGFPSWFLGRNPTRYVISASHTAELATDFGRRVLGLVGSPLHRAVFPDCRLTEESAASTRFNTSAGGAYYAVGRGGTILGRRAHLLIVDDPAKDQAELRSAAFRREMREWFASTAYTRLMPGAAVVVIASRMHEDDLPGWLLREHASDGWRVISMPAIAEEDEAWRKKGEALWPEMFGEELLARIRTNVGSAVWQSLYQQRPTSEESQIFKAGWWQSYRERPAEVLRIVMSADTAFQASETADYSAVTIWAETRAGYYLLLAFRERLEFPGLKAKLVALAAEWKPNALLIENRASGQSAIQELRSNTSLPVLPVQADRDKVSRAMAVTPMIEAGRVFLPESAPWLPDYLDELSSFPAGAHDDQVDSTTQALNWMRGGIQWTADEFARAYAEEITTAQPLVAAAPGQPPPLVASGSQSAGGTLVRETVLPSGSSRLEIVAPKTR